MPTAVMVGLDKDLLNLIQEERLAEVVGIFQVGGSGENALGVPVIGEDSAWAEWSISRPDVRVIVSIDPPRLRRALSAFYGSNRCISIVSRRAAIAASAKVGHSAIVQHQVTISADVTIGIGVKINVGATLHHDCRLGDFVTIAPGARLLGKVIVDEDAYVGASATILPNLRVGRGAVVGAGAVVAEDVLPETTVVGVPAKATRSH
jgi:sugar O-acyltransferase (sialic acid O-acetyltransferase NeuD family)